MHDLSKSHVLSVARAQELHVAAASCSWRCGPPCHTGLELGLRLIGACLGTKGLRNSRV